MSHSVSCISFYWEHTSWIETYDLWFDCAIRKCFVIILSRFFNSIFHSAVHILSHVADKLLQWCQPNNKQLFFRLHSFQWIYSLPLTRRKNVGSAYDFRCHQRLSHVLCHFVLLYSPLMRLLLQVSTCVCILYYIHPFLAFNRSFSSLSPCKCIHIFAHFHPIKISSTL